MSVSGTPRSSLNRRWQISLRTHSTKTAIEGLLFVLPVVLGVLIFTYAPVAFSVYGSLTRWDAINPPEFIGLYNYQRLFSDYHFTNSVKNTFYFTLGSVPLAMLLGLGMAFLVNQKIRGVNLYRTAYFVPVVTSVIAVGIVWEWMFSAYFGPVNTLLGWFGINGPDWLHNTRWAMPAVIIVSAWQRAGYNMVLYLAGLQGIPRELYEAASIDGANSFQRATKITWPLLTPTTFFVLIISFIASFQVFGLIYVMTNGGPGTATAVYIYYLYQNAFQFFRMGYAQAMAWLLFLGIGLITLIQWKLQDRWVHYR